MIRKGKEITYFNEDNSECDFIAKDKSFETYQVCFELNDNNKDREIKGLVFAMDFFKLKIGYILTYYQEDEFNIDNKVIPVWKWLLE